MRPDVFGNVMAALFAKVRKSAWASGPPDIALIASKLSPLYESAPQKGT
jgi:hypothetical protein